MHLITNPLLYLQQGGCANVIHAAAGSNTSAIAWVQPDAHDA
jgi:hypothetical protein